MIKHAVIGTDFSKAVNQIIQNAQELKSLGIEKLTLVHVLNLRDKIFLEDFTIERLEKKLSDQRSELERKGFHVQAEMVYGSPVIELENIRRKVHAELIIITSHGLKNNPSVLGNTASELIQNIKAALLLIVLKRIDGEEEALLAKNIYQYERIMKDLENKEPEWDFYTKDLTRHILLPTDFSDFSEQAFQLLRNQNIAIPELTLLHIQDMVRIDKYLKDKLDEFNSIDHERLKRLSASFKKKHPETKVNIKIDYGKPTDMILEYINQNQVTLTLMGSQGRGSIAKFFLGSVSHQVTRHADSHVLLVPVKGK